MVHELMLKFACNTLQLPACIQFCQKQFFAWMDRPVDDIPIHPRGRKIVLGVALKTIRTRLDESRKFVNSLYHKANVTKQKLKGSHATFSFLEILKSNLSKNINSSSTSPESAEPSDTLRIIHCSNGSKFLTVLVLVLELTQVYWRFRVRFWKTQLI